MINLAINVNKDNCRRISIPLNSQQIPSPPLTEELTIPLGKHDYSETENDIPEDSEGEDINPKNLRIPPGCSFSIGKIEFREIVGSMAPEVRFTGDALDLLQKESEKMIVEFLGEANQTARANGREKITVKDLEEAQKRK